MKEQPNVQPEAPDTANEAPLGEHKKASLLRYMTILFAFAFVLVLLSLLIQTRNSQSAISKLSQSSASAFANAEQLQDDNRALENSMDAMEERLEHQQQTIRSLRDRKDEAENEAAACRALLTLLTTNPEVDETAYQNALTTVNRLRSALSEDALAIYEDLIAETP